jgi:hypothetical protein
MLGILGILCTIYLYQIDCMIEWVMDGRTKWVQDGPEGVSIQDYDPVSKRRRIRVSWCRSDQFIGPKRTEQEELYLYAPLRNLKHLNAGTNWVSDEEPEFLTQGSNVEIHAGIKRWIKLCEEKHQNVYTPIEVKDRKAFRDLVCQTWFCVVDVHRMCLTSLKPENDEDELESYAALSYVWGTEQEHNNQTFQSSVPKRKRDHRTLRSNIMERKEKGGLTMEQLPETIRDAIQLVKDLGLRFIWIDSLCILQDDVNFKSWKRNAEKMDLIFGNAHFTICAADGDSAAGLRAINPKTRNHPLKIKVNDDLELLVSSSPESVIQTSQWSERGWTFQERILSPRCIIFAQGRIYLQCRENNFDDSNMIWNSDWRKSPLSTMRKLQDRPIWFYMTCVELYTGRNLTEPTDILKAFNGVSRVIEDQMCAPFIFGLPSSHFDFALLWRPKSGKERRDGDPKKDAEFPSWSWSGWQVPKLPEKGPAVYYPPDVLEGCLLDIHDWLIHHTWIVWYIRNSNGDLEPLWQGYTGDHTKRLQNVKKRWKGYFKPGDTKSEGGKNDVSAYGRDRYPYDLPSPRTEFYRTLPDNGFGTRISRERKNSLQSILQFWTWKCEFNIVLNNHPGAGLARCDVLDNHRNWCGTVVVDESWAKDHNQKTCQFIALSDARKFTDDECTSWTYTIPKNLEDIEWDLYHVMLVEEFEARCVCERMGLGKVLKAAFKGAEWAEIILS